MTKTIEVYFSGYRSETVEVEMEEELEQETDRIVNEVLEANSDCNIDLVC